MPNNSYDKADTVRMHSMIKAGSLKLASYTVRDPETGEHGALQFHATFDNTILALMGDQSARLFVNFVNEALATRPDFEREALSEPLSIIVRAHKLSEALLDLHIQLTALDIKDHPEKEAIELAYARARGQRGLGMGEV